MANTEESVDNSNNFLDDIYSVDIEHEFDDEVTEDVSIEEEAPEDVTEESVAEETQETVEEPKVEENTPEPQTTEPVATKEPEVEESTEEKKDFMDKLLEDPEGAIKERFNELRQAEKDQEAQEAQAREIENTFNTQREALIKEIPEASALITNEKVLAMPDNVKHALVTSGNMAEGAFYYAKFGTISPSLSQLKSLVGGVTTDTPQKEIPQPISSKGNVEVDTVIDDIHSVDI